MEKKLKVLTSGTARSLVSSANEFDVKKDDIVDIKFIDGQFILFYYQ